MGEKKPISPPASIILPRSTTVLISLLLILELPKPFVSAQGTTAAPFTKRDNFLINCGGTKKVTGPKGEPFQTDQEAQSLLSAGEGDNHLVEDPSVKVDSPWFSSARVFLKEATYTFPLQDSGWHWIRLYFLPLKTDVFKLDTAKFHVFTDDVTLLHSFSYSNMTQPIMREYLTNIRSPRYSIRFVPEENSAAFINAIELVTAPEKLFSDTAQSLFPVDQMNGLSRNNFEVVYRLNAGGPLITASNDTLGRMWVPDEPFLKEKSLAKAITTKPAVIKYPDNVTPFTAPQTVYASAQEMADSGTVMQNFNITWQFDVDKSYSYLVRMHFCDIVSKALNELYFNVYVNGKTAISGLDLSSLSDQLATANYQDIFVNSSLMSDKLVVQVGPTKLNTGVKNAILNGVEVLKMNNSAHSLDGGIGPHGEKLNDGSSTGHAVAAVGFAMMFGAFVGLGAMVIKWRKRPQDWQRRKSFSSWLLPLHASDTSFASSKNSSIFSSTGGLGRRFAFSEIQEATKGFDEGSIIGVGGFGNVYSGELDGVKVAVKRGNPQSDQGVNEFMTEIQMLSKLRHKHLVSLIGYCDENNEMILVYEFMSNGPFRDHLYGKGKQSLSWKQRVEICIGAARGLHYLHTGSAQGIIHRDVKTTNILLDEAFVAKMADFGLSKDGPGQAQDHVSTAVKGSFGYLDPEYFRKQQLTEKSDVYSFGVVLLEVLCARAPISPALPREQVNLAEWAMKAKRQNMLEKIMDPSLAGSISPESMKKFAEAAESCLEEYGVDRPTMGDVTWNLEHALQLQEQWEAENGTNPTAAPTAVVTSNSSVAGDVGSASTPIPPNVDGMDDRSGTELLKQFSSLSGR